MATNIDNATGFTVRKFKPGGINRYFIPATDETAVFLGDAVKSAGGGDAVEGVSTVTQATASGSPGDGNAAAIRGVVVGFDMISGMTASTLNIYGRYRPADTAMYVLVCDDPDAEFEIQCDDVGATLAAADLQLNADIVIGSGNTTTGMSGMELDTSSKGTTAAVQLKIIKLVPRAGNNQAVANQRVIVKIDNHELSHGTGTVGVS